MILPAIIKWVHGGRTPHFFCPGEGCGERLACGDKEVTNKDGGREIVACLEPRYTNGPHPSYPAGTWWRQERSGYKGIPSVRDARKAGRDIDRATEGVPPEAVGQVIKETLKKRDLLDDVLEKDSTAHVTAVGRLTGPAGKRVFRDVTEFPRRGIFHEALSILSWGRRHVQPRPALPPGTHTIVCYRCRGKASITTPISGSLLGSGSISISNPRGGVLPPPLKCIGGGAILL